MSFKRIYRSISLFSDQNLIKLLQPKYINHFNCFYVKVIDSTVNYLSWEVETYECT